MNIISHRGFWKNPSEKNGVAAFMRAIKCGYGIETDVRDDRGELVISHDIPYGGCQLLHDFLKDYIKFSSSQKYCPWLAINIKSDGLQGEIKKQLLEHKVKNYFVFDMSIPDTLGYIRHGIKCFVRQSEFDVIPELMDGYDGVWIDQFNSTWFNEEVLCEHYKDGFLTCIVSPEIHGRDYAVCWDLLKRTIKRCSDKKRSDMMLCTDYPDIADNYFNGN